MICDCYFMEIVMIVDCLKLLLDNGADVNLARHDGFTAFHAAAAQGNHG